MSQKVGACFSDSTYLHTLFLGLDIHSGCSPVLVKNVYKRTNIAGAGAGDASSLTFDIVKVKGCSDGVKAGSSDEIITVTEDSNETKIVEEMMR